MARKIQAARNDSPVCTKELKFTSVFTANFEAFRIPSNLLDRLDLNSFHALLSSLSPAVPYTSSGLTS